MAPNRVAFLACCVSALVVSWASAQRDATAPAAIRGFSRAASATEVDRERELKALPSAKANETDFDVMTAEPHHVGSPYEIALADYVGDRFREAGLDVSRYEYSVLVPWPTERRVELVAPEVVKLRVDEEIVPGDPWPSKKGVLPAYNAYSPAGDVTGDVVYVNYGVPADYERLRELGIDVKGKVVLARYGGSWRGIKPKVAAEHGAIGCLIYSDPHEDGFFQGTCFPTARSAGGE